MFEKKKKETLTVENIKQDLLNLEKEKLRILIDWRLYSKAIPFGVIVLCMVLVVWIIPDLPEAKVYEFGAAIVAVVFSILVIYNLAVFFEHLFVKRKKELMCIETTDFTVHEDTLKKVEETWIYEPHIGCRYNMDHKFVYMFHFSDEKVRLYKLKKHYSWSKDFYLSTTGVSNTSLEGDEFYVVRMNADEKIVYFYNKKFFDFKE